MTTLGRKMADAAGRPSGFDYMRFVLSTIVILHHSFLVTGDGHHAEAIWNGPDRACVAFVLPMFFSLSGFLIAGSLERTRSLFGFLGLRVIRLAPALAAEILLSALVLGPLLTAYTLSAYFHDIRFRLYFLNLLGDIHFNLPGMFVHNPFNSEVNTQLWTIPIELKCYLALAAVALFGAASRNRLFLWSMLVSGVVLICLLFMLNPMEPPVPHGKVLAVCFFAGIMFYKFQERIALNGVVFVSCVIGSMVLFFLHYGSFFVFLPITYVTVYLGSANPRRCWIISSGDYSYGMYLYSYPIQQAFTSMGAWTHSPWLNFVVTYPASIAVAYVSWHLIEKRALKLKRHVATGERWLFRLPLIRWHSRLAFGFAGEEPVPYRSSTTAKGRRTAPPQLRPLSAMAKSAVFKPLVIGLRSMNLLRQPG